MLHCGMLFHEILHKKKFFLKVSDSHTHTHTKELASHMLASTRLGDCKGPHLSAGKGTEPIRKGHNYGGRKLQKKRQIPSCQLFSCYED